MVRGMLIAFLLAAGLAPVASVGQPMPTGSGALNVRAFGALGDGRSDDTAAIFRAIKALPSFDPKNPFSARILYFPAGVYAVSDTIKRVDEAGRFQPGLVLVGETKAVSRIRLLDGSTGFGDPSVPKPMIFMTSAQTGSDPHAGGKHYPESGEGNEAYQNTVENLTLDVGDRNSGAVGLDYLASNVGAVRRVDVVAGSAGGATGIRMVRKWIGPALLDEVSVRGFSVGVDVGSTEYSVTFERLHIEGSRTVGLRTTQNAVTLSDVHIDTTDGFAIGLIGPTAAVVALKGTITGSGRDTILDRGGMRHMAGIEAGGFRASTRSPRAVVNGVFLHGSPVAESLFRLPIRSAPDDPVLAPAEWASLADFGARAGSGSDDTAAVRAALASGSAGLFFPPGDYNLRAGIAIPPNVKIIDGMYATLRVAPMGATPNSLAAGSTAAAQPAGRPLGSVFTVGPRSSSLHVRRIGVVGTPGTRTIFEDRSGAGLVLRDIAGSGIGLVERTAQGGPFFASNVSCSGLSLAGRAGAWLRQFNTEGRGVRINNTGSPLWILGLKTEQQMTVLSNRDGADTEIVGGFHYMVRPASPADVPLHVNSDSRLVASYVEESFVPESTYKTHLVSSIGGRETRVVADDLPLRGRFSRFAPQIVAGAR